MEVSAAGVEDALRGIKKKGNLRRTIDIVLMRGLSTGCPIATHEQLFASANDHSLTPFNISLVAGMGALGRGRGHRHASGDSRNQLL